MHDANSQKRSRDREKRPQYQIQIKIVNLKNAVYAQCISNGIESTLLYVISFIHFKCFTSAY